jgi:hypothetical protein
MRIKLSNKNKAYWLNYLGYWLVFILCSLVLSSIDHYDGEPLVFNFKLGFIITSIISSFILAHFIAKKYRRNEEIDELRVKEGLDYKEFNSKYGHLLKIID